MLCDKRIQECQIVIWQNPHSHIKNIYWIFSYDISIPDI